MKYRTRIWMLTLCAAAVFVKRLLVSLWAGDRTWACLVELRDMHAPHFAGVLSVDRTVEQFRLALQTAVAESDADRLKAVEALRASSRTTVAGPEAIPDRSSAAREPGASIEAYEAAAVEQQKHRAAGAVKQAEDATLKGVDKLRWPSLATGATVLAAWGVASWLTMRAVWREPGAEPAELRAAARRVAGGDLGAEIRLEGGHDSLAASVASFRLASTHAPPGGAASFDAVPA